MRRSLALLVLLAAAPLRAALVVPEAGLPEGQLVGGMRFGLAFQPVDAGRWTALQNVVSAGLAVEPGFKGWADLPQDKGSLAAAPLEMLLSETFWSEAGRFASLSQERRAELIRSLALAQRNVGRVIDKRGGAALEQAQELIAQGKLGEADLARLAETLESLSVHGERTRAAALEARGAVELSKTRREAAAFGLKAPDAVVGSESVRRTFLVPRLVEERQDRTPEVPRPPTFWKLGSSKWYAKAGLIALGVWIADIATKAFAQAHLFSAFHEVAWRRPIMAVVVPYMLYAAYKAYVGLPKGQTDYHWSWRRLGSRGAGLGGWLGFTKERIPGLDEVKTAHPSLIRAYARFEVAIGIMLGGLFGNAIDAFLKGGALDWIPVGRSLMNLADVAIILGLSYWQLAGYFFITAARAAGQKRAMSLDLTSYLGLPIIGFFVAWAFGGGKGETELTMAFGHIGWIYLMGFSMLLGMGRVIASYLIRRDVARFNAEAAGTARPPASDEKA